MSIWLTVLIAGLCGGFLTYLIVSLSDIKSDIRAIKEVFSLIVKMEEKDE